MLERYYLGIEVPYEEHEQKSGNQKNQAMSQRLIFRFKVWIDGTQQADSPTPASQCSENIFRYAGVSWIHIGESVGGRVMFLRFDNCDE